MLWKQERTDVYPTPWKRMFLFSKLCVGHTADDKEIWARFKWVEQRWLDGFKEQIRVLGSEKPVTYFRYRFGSPY